jgi:hypothetical protein
MNRRLYFVLPDKQSAQQIERELLLQRFDGNHIRFLTGGDTALDDLPQAGPLQTGDIKRGIKFGVLSGGLTGIGAGLLMVLIPALHTGLGIGAMPVLAVTGALFGAWAGGLVGASVPSTGLKPFAGDLDSGRIVLMLDAPKKRIQEIARFIMQRHPEADNRGIDPSIPAFP